MKKVEVYSLENLSNKDKFLDFLRRKGFELYGNNYFSNITLKSVAVGEVALHYPYYVTIRGDLAKCWTSGLTKLAEEFNINN